MVDVSALPVKTVKYEGEVYMLKFGVSAPDEGVGEELIVCADANLALE
jgi:hypothetical protein